MGVNALALVARAPGACNQLHGQVARVTSDNTHLSLPTLIGYGQAQPACNQLHGDSSDDGVINHYLDACWADATKRAYAGDLRDFLAWGGEVPASSESIARYIADRASKLSPATLARRLVGIGTAHTLGGYPDPTRNPLVGRVLKGIRRTHGIAQRRALPLDPRKLQQAWSQSDSLRGRRDRALVLLGFAGC